MDERFFTYLLEKHVIWEVFTPEFHACETDIESMLSDNDCVGHMKFLPTA